MADKITTSINSCLELETLNDSLILLKACVNFISYSSVTILNLKLFFFWLDKIASSILKLVMSHVSFLFI